MHPTLRLNVYMKSTGGFTIGELAHEFGLATHVLRHWESMGLLQPGRDGVGQRRYGEADLVRVALILIGKEAGFGLRELQILLGTDNPMSHPELLRRHVAALEDRIARATAAKQLIEHALACPAAFDECPHAKEQIAARIPSRMAPIGK
ncbi:MerR family transcriptional regulator [Catellatospora sichuanensis]|uniref:MerR family transcriptional regulator n=1 Tax=Catellatospora sichuanensis TaxID=1969805 RepID=UPI001C911B18|nr:MerR family transcriptional regulator [Catellatospora sichuanensis]